ncbi:hypothetical protein [Coralloluteibacterium stylophorae]|uniref:DUF2259 domain-containing protein n=1 Tax=Coralloluteibacterium stylophorae TaxID=1776034 RepID=A0A8J7VQB2_9GAMM|nr:hypothetical protein [Coralloluteibacterium stylophorae]MBS7456891.1 hypothetical protein [Coralloluteibacterium stylophorae]
MTRARMFPRMAVALLAAAGAVGAQAAVMQYAGTLGGARVTVQIEVENQVAAGLYFYDRYRTPIGFKPTMQRNGPRMLDEVDAGGLPTARLRFDQHDFFASTRALTGTWTDYRSRRQLPFRLDLAAYSDWQATVAGAPFAILQLASTERFYFRVPGDEGAPVARIEVLAKADGALVQTLVLPAPTCNRGMRTVEVAVEQARTVLRLPESARCPGAVFALDPRGGRFERLSP